MPDGRLANPDCSLGTDPRSDPRMIKALAPFGMDALVPELPVTVDSPVRHRLAFIAMAEEMSGAVFESFAQSMPIAEGVTTTTVTVPGGDGQDLTLYVSRPDTAVALPCIVHLHGGGMAMLSAADTPVMRGRENLAATGLVVVGVEFRNSAGKLGNHPYPAGLNDCAAAVRWVFANREATRYHSPDRFRRIGWRQPHAGGHAQGQARGLAHEIAGAYAQCPFICNRWLEQPDEFCR